MARRYKKGRAYTQEEMDLIMLTPKKALPALAEKLGRNAESVRRKRWQLDNVEADRLTRRRYVRRAQEEGKDSATYANSRWTKEEEDLILTSELTDRELAKELKRTVYSIATKRLRLLREHSKETKKQYGRGWEKEIKKGVEHESADRQGDTEQIQ